MHQNTQFLCKKNSKIFWGGGTPPQTHPPAGGGHPRGLQLSSAGTAVPQCHRQTDGQTDGRLTIVIPRYACIFCIARHNKVIKMLQKCFVSCNHGLSVLLLCTFLAAGLVPFNALQLTLGRTTAPLSVYLPVCPSKRT